MGIRWKNNLIFIICIVLLTFGLSALLSGMRDGRKYINKDYFHTQGFEFEFDRFIHALNTFELNAVSKDKAKEMITVTADDIKEHRNRYGTLTEQVTNIKGQYEGKIRDALAAGNNEVATIYTAERDKKIEDITKNFKDDEYVREKVLKEKQDKVDKYYRQMEGRLSDFTRYKEAFKYYVRDTETGDVYKNVDVADEEAFSKLFNEKNVLFTKEYPNSVAGRYYSGIDYPQEIATSITKQPHHFEGKIVVPSGMHGTNPIIVRYKQYNHEQKAFFIYIVSGILALLLSFYLYKKNRTQFIMMKKWQAYYKRIPIDVRVIALILTLYITRKYLGRNAFYLDTSLSFIFTHTLFSLITSACWVTITFFQGKLLWDSIKFSSLQEEWENSLIYKAYRGVKQAFLIRSVGTKVCIILAIVFMFGLGLVLVAKEPVLILLYGPLLLVLGIPLLVLIVKNTGRFNQIVHYTEQLAQGNYEKDLPVKGKGVFATLATNINTLKANMKVSQSEQAKSERLKTELITNVSHDLRTPLTSIITYAELLKTSNLNDEDRAAYVEIIDRKSKRLKVLIDDLFEASKMVSGNIDLMKEKVDIMQLLQQALAEHDETIQKSTLQFRVTNSDTPIFAVVDGQKLWRVFDNVISNILKYSLEHTRVYISVTSTVDKVMIAFKNVSKYELGGNIDELFERFKRGDASRHTEGSGLGLAIAKSIVDLHDGSLEIDIDGDLFKVIVSLPL
ncbi:sensor histidine kinase [Microbacteriaceae bacterium 4G12]